MIRSVQTIGLSVLLLGCGQPEEGRWIEERLATRASFRAVCFLDPERGFIVGGDYFIDGGIIGATTDGGRSWTFRSGLVRAKAGFSLTDIVFLDRFVGIAVATHGVVLRTEDRGRNWHQVRRYTGGTDHFLDLFFLDENHGWAVGFSGIIHTTDGGRTWAWIGSRRSIAGSAVHFLDVEKGLVAGKHGRVYQTTDGGHSWTRVTEEIDTGTADLSAMTFVGPARGWAVGADGTILHTGDGGYTWRRQPSGVDGWITDVAFVDPDRGWAVAADRSKSSSTVLRTSDGGETWRTDLVVDGELLNAIQFRDAGRGWAVGERPEHGPQVLLRYRDD